MSDGTPYQAAVYRALKRLANLTPEQRKAEQKQLLMKRLQIRSTPSR